MRKTLIATSALALLLASGSALAAFDGTHVSSSGGAKSISGGLATSSGNGSASVWTGGAAVSVHGARGSSDASYRAREGHATVQGVTEAHTFSGTVITTRGNGFAMGGSAAKAGAEAGGIGYFDTHRSNPEGFVLGGSKAHSKSLSGGISSGNGRVNAANESGTSSGFLAHAEGNRDGGYRGRPVVDSVSTEVDVWSASYDNSGRLNRRHEVVDSPVVRGGAIGGEWSATGGKAFGLATAEAGRVRSHSGGN